MNIYDWFTTQPLFNVNIQGKLICMIFNIQLMFWAYRFFFLQFQHTTPLTHPDILIGTRFKLWNPYKILDAPKNQFGPPIYWPNLHSMLIN